MSRKRRARHQAYMEAETGKDAGNQKSAAAPMDDSDTLMQATTQLNHSDDGHWTKKGMPDCNVLTEMCGFKVSRKMMTDQFPDLKRAKPD